MSAEAIKSEHKNIKNYKETKLIRASLGVNVNFQFLDRGQNVGDYMFIMMLISEQIVQSVKLKYDFSDVFTMIVLNMILDQEPT